MDLVPGGGRHGGLELGELGSLGGNGLVELCYLSVEVHHALEHEVHFGSVAHRPHAAALFDLGVVRHDARVGGLGQRHDVVLLLRHDLAHLGAAAAHKDGRSLRGLEAIAVAHGAHDANDLKHRLDVSLCPLVDQGLIQFRILGDHDAALIGGPSRQALPQLLGHEGHKGVEEAQALFDAVVEHRLRALGLRRVAAKHGLAELQVNVAEVIEEKRIDGGGGSAEVVGKHGLVRAVNRLLQLAQDPAVLRRKLVARRQSGRDIAREVHHAELGGVPQLIAEVAVALHAQHIEINVAALARVGRQREAERVGATLWNA